MYIVSLLLEKKEFEKIHNNFLHILGVSGINDFFILAFVQKFLNERFDNKIQLSTDSSSPNRATIFGSYFFDINWKTLSYITMYFGKDGRTDYDLSAKLPCRLDCPACRNITYKDIAAYTPETYMYMTAHNLHIMIDAMNVINKVVDSHEILIKELVGSGYYQIYNGIKEIFRSTTPLITYEKYKPLFQKYSSALKHTSDKESSNKFFKF